MSEYSDCGVLHEDYFNHFQFDFAFWDVSGDVLVTAAAAK